MEIKNLLYGHFGPRNWWPGDTEFEVCVGAVLTQNTAWKNVEKAIENLKEEKLLTLKKLHRAGEERIAPLIRPSGSYNLKAKRLMSLVEYLTSISADKNGAPDGAGWLDHMKKEKLESARESLLAVYGVGPETADCILLYAAGRASFVIDKYTLRFGERFGLFPAGETYEGARSFFMAHLPKSVPLYNEYHAQVVALGNRYCKPKPLCGECPLDKLCKKRSL